MRPLLLSLENTAVSMPLNSRSCREILRNRESSRHGGSCRSERKQGGKAATLWRDFAGHWLSANAAVTAIKNNHTVSSESEPGELSLQDPGR